MRQYAIPCIISLLVGALYNIVDQIFIANASYLGSYGNAANTVVFPLTVVALAIAVMLGDGCCAFVSMALGRNEVDKAKRSVGNAVVLSVVSSLVLTAVYLIFANTIIAMFGGTVNEETFRHSQEYFFYITLGIPFYMFGQAMNPIIRADGNPKFAMISTLAGAAINIILDPIFIFVFKWGMMGAAVATVIGQVATAFLAVWYLLHMKIIKPASGDYALRGTVCGRMLTLGITSFLSQISLVAAMAAINNMLRKYGALDAVFGQEQYAQIPMAVVGIVMKFFQIVISIVVGMAAGCIPIVGFNMGAEKFRRVNKLFTMLLISEAAVGAVALDDALVAVALADAGDVDLVADCENACLNFVADVHLGGLLHAELLEVLLEGNLSLFQMAELRLGQLGFLDVLKAKLYGVVAVFFGGLLLGHDAGAGLDDGDRDEAVVGVPDLGHAELRAQQALHLAFESGSHWGAILFTA